MPEGPEIHRAADRLDSVLRRRKAQDVFFAFEHLKPFESELTGRRIRGVEARGKAVLVRFSGDWAIYSHNQLYGRWYIERPGVFPVTARSLRVAVQTRGSSALLYSASDIEVLQDGALDRHPYLGSLGPDPLAAGTTIAEIAEQIAEPQFAGRSFASLLLDQGFIAGVGNYLRSEILFFAGLHPRCRPADCSPRELASLAATAFEVTRRSYETGGVTNPKPRAALLRRQGLDFRRYRHAVFGRASQRCWDCGSSVRKENLAGRRAFYCPDCQPLSD